MRFSYIVLIGLVLAVFGVGSVFLKPVKLPQEIKIEIPYGTSISKSGDMLEEKGIIKSKEAFMIVSKILYPRGIVAGTYSFSGNVTIFSALNSLANGKFGRNQIKLTIPEGFTVEEITNRITNLFPLIDAVYVKDSLSDKEGYIFPETYFFDNEVKALDLISYLTQRSTQKITKILSPMKIESPEAKKIMIVASLIESEGRTKKEREMIAGIIENRLRIGMPLQLDATLQYITGRGSSELTLRDLKIDSPYNTYINKGLPPTPISNPGEESILAAKNWTKNDYLYYLHDKDGNIHYAKTLQEHVSNKNKYLR